jgi:hypothetical protein
MALPRLPSIPSYFALSQFFNFFPFHLSFNQKAGREDLAECEGLGQRGELGDWWEGAGKGEVCEEGPRKAERV